LTGLETLADSIEAKLSQVKPEDVIAADGKVDLLLAIAKRNLPDMFAEGMKGVFSDQAITSVFSHSGAVCSDLTLFFFNMIAPACFSFSEGRLLFNKLAFLQMVTDVGRVIETGEVEYTIAFRLMNFDIPHSIELADSVCLRRLSQQDIAHKYPVQREWMATSSMQERYWNNHCVEAVIERKGHPSDMERDTKLENLDALEKSITNSFALSGIRFRVQAQGAERG